MTTIKITHPAKEVDEFAIGSRLYLRFLGMKGRAAITFAFVLPMVGIPAVVHHLTDLDMLRSEVLLLTWVFYGSFICWILTSAYFVRSARRFSDQSTYRQRSTTWVLSAKGCQQIDGIFLPWHDLTDMFQLKRTTILDFAMRRAVVVPDHALPDDLSPNDLIAQVTAWKSI